MSRQACYTDACSQARGHDGDCTLDVERIRAQAFAEGEKAGYEKGRVEHGTCRHCGEHVDAAHAAFGGCPVVIAKAREEGFIEGEKAGAAEEREKWKATFAELTKMLAFDVAKARQEALEEAEASVCEDLWRKFGNSLAVNIARDSIRALAKVKPR